MKVRPLYFICVYINIRSLWGGIDCIFLRKNHIKKTKRNSKADRDGSEGGTEVSRRIAHINYKRYIFTIHEI